MRGTGVLLGILTLSLPAGCGDPPLCQSDIFVAIQTSQIVTDANALAPGVQADIQVRTSLEVGETVSLDVLDLDGAVAHTATAIVIEGGNAIFEDVLVPPPRVTLRASAASFCGTGSDELTIDVIAGADCQLVVSPAPEDNPFYAPLDVLTTVTDPDPATPGYQATVLVSTRAGWTVELFENTGTGEQRIATATADANGLAKFERTLLDGQLALRSTCTNGGVSAPSPTTTVIVDTQPPTCAFTSPAPGTTITPSFDQNGMLDDGVQLAVTMAIGGNDVENEPTTLTITPVAGAPVTVPTTEVDADGTSTGSTTLMPPTTPASFEFALTGRDHAGNTCASQHTFDVVYDGCDIAVTAPTAPVTIDANANPGDGSQVDVTLQVAAACVGRTVTSTCGSDSPSGVVPAGGQLTLRATVCSTSPCEAQAPCTFRVSTALGVQTSASSLIEFDDQGPSVALELVTPPLACGAQITPASDADSSLDGVQLVARVISPGAAERRLELTNANGTTSAAAATDVTVTLAAGQNRLVGVGLDALDNLGQSAACTVILADLSVSFSPPAADGLIGLADGTASGGAITFPLCGTVNRTGTTVSLTIDGGTPVPASVTGTTWCRTITLTESPPLHTVVADATDGTSFGSGSVVLRVDLTPPPEVDAFSAFAVNRQRLRMTWQAPSDGGQPAAAQLLKVATTTLTDANFDVTGTVIATAPPGAPGTPESAELFPARTGTAYWVAIATRDAAGNRSVAQVIGPITPGFDRTGALTAPDPSAGALALGSAIAHGRFNDDDFEDLAISAPTQNTGALRGGAVYVYFGGPALIAPLPDLVITHSAADARFGAGLATVRWSSATRDDLVVGAPGADGSGRMFVFEGGASFGTGMRAASSADLHIAVHSVAPGWFAGSALGSALARADVDGDGLDDLVASAPHGGGTGGVAIFYGGTITGNVLVSDVENGGINGAVVELFQDPGSTPGRQLGFYLHAVGRTEGPLDTTDDVIVAYADDTATTGDSLFVLRGSGTAPSAAGVTVRAFVAGRDVRIDLPSVSPHTEWGSQAISIDDQNGDGARELVISAYAEDAGAGRALVLSGHVLGAGGVTSTSTPGTTFATITGTAGTRFGAFVLAHDKTSPDIDGDGLEDLVIGGAPSGHGKAFVWFGGAIPSGSASVTSAQLVIDAPLAFTFAPQSPIGAAGQARWVGDLDGDGLADVCWASPFDNSGDGSFEILAD